MRLVTGQESEQHSGTTIVGLSFKPYCLHTTANTAFSDLPVDWTGLIAHLRLEYPRVIWIL